MYFRPLKTQQDKTMQNLFISRSKKYNISQYVDLSQNELSQLKKEREKHFEQLNSSKPFFNSPHKRTLKHFHELPPSYIRNAKGETQEHGDTNQKFANLQNRYPKAQIKQSEDACRD